MTTVSDIALRVLPHFGLGAHDIASLLRGQRSKSLSEARAIVCWVVRRRHSWSLKEIARAVGYRDHSSVIDAIQIVEQRPLLLRVATTVLEAMPGANQREAGRERTGAREIELEATG